MEDVVFTKALIIGSGPAGLMAACEMLKLGVAGKDILILEKGPDLEHRVSARQIGEEKYNNLGFGGAGLFSDGKFSVPDHRFPLIPKTQTILNKFDSVPNPELSESEALTLLEYTFEQFILLESRYALNLNPDIENLEILKEKFSLHDVSFAYYHVYQLNTSLLPQLLNKIYLHLISAGVRIFCNSSATELQNGNISCSIDGLGINCNYKYLVLAVGKVGSKWLLGQIEKLKLATTYRPVDIGIRVEIPRELMSEFTKIHKDFKLFRYINETSLVKTFCVCDGGKVVPCYYDDLLVLGGFTDSELSENTNFGLLFRSVPSSIDPTVFGTSIIKKINDFGHGQPIVQRLGDLRKQEATLQTRIDVNTIKPTLNNYTLADLTQIIPFNILSPLITTLDKIGKVINGINHDDVIISAPCLEACYPRFVVNKYMETSQQDIYVVGDIAGYSKGIVSAAASGILAARDIARKLLY